MNSEDSPYPSKQLINTRPQLTVETGVSRYDMFNGALIASIALFGFLASILFLVWVTTQFDFSRKLEPPPYQSEYGDEKPEGFEDDVLEPGVEEFPEIDIPALPDALEAVTDAVSSVSAALEVIDGDSPVVGKGSGAGSIDGGTGNGDADVVPEHKRWKIEYASEDISDYAKQLSHFGIDIGAVSIDANDIMRIQDPGGKLNTVATSREKENKARSLFFAHTQKKLQRWDARLVKRAGVELAGKDIVQFYPDPTRGLLRAAESEYLLANDRELGDVGKTFFKIVSTGSGYTFEVSSMQFRRR